jgi:hypothetical protein
MIHGYINSLFTARETNTHARIGVPRPPVAHDRAIGNEITRGTATFTTGVIFGILPLSKGDKITITYTIAPDINFIPG